MSNPTDEERGFQLVDDPGDEQTGLIPPLTFATFVISLSTSAMVHLGASPDVGEEGELNLALAQQTIDILEILLTKTQGNLDSEESQLLEGVLYDLRMRYVAAANAAK